MTESRPDDCVCREWWPEDHLNCWPCHRVGFRTPNPNPPEKRDEAEEKERQAKVEQQTLEEARAVAGGQR